MTKFSATRRALLAGVAFAAVLATGAFAADKPTMGVVVKIGGIPWFNAMEAGIKEEGAKDGVDAFMIGPTSADPSLQVRAIEDLIAKKVDVIGIVPNDEKALEPVLEKARKAGIKVVAHEGPGIQNKDWDFELARPKASAKRTWICSPRRWAVRANTGSMSARLRFRCTTLGPTRRSPI